jgi:SAM-dependent methyltransferase
VIGHLDQVPKEFLEVVPCGICGGGSAKRRFSVRGFPILRCRSCGTSYVSPRLIQSKLAELYSQKNYYESDNSLVCGYMNYLADRENILATFRRRLDWLRGRSGGSGSGRLLDIGCAAGFSVEAALERGWDAYGIEPSAYAAEAARQRLGNRVVRGTVDDIPFPRGHFRAVLLWDVIEHVPNPLGVLRRANELSEPGGLLSIITPDCGSPVARLMGKFWMEYAKPTEHIFFFNRRTLTDALERAGFKAIAVSTAGKHVGLDFLLERLRAYFPILGKRNTAGRKETPARRSFYLDPGDKMMILARKGE